MARNIFCFLLLVTSKKPNTPTASRKGARAASFCDAIDNFREVLAQAPFMLYGLNTFLVLRLTG